MINFCFDPHTSAAQKFVQFFADMPHLCRLAKYKICLFSVTPIPDVIK